MLKLRQYVIERFKSEHEDKIRQIASQARTKYFAKGNKNKPKSATEWGDCGNVSNCVAKHLRKNGYKSAKTVGGDHHTKDGDVSVGHNWVEVPEVKHYVDPTHDQFRKRELASHRKGNQPTIKGRYHNSAIKIGHTDSHEYKKKYKTNFEDLSNVGPVGPGTEKFWNK